MAGTLIASLEGPKGMAEICEVVEPVSSGGQRFEYEVYNGGEVQRFLTLGEAYITAKELTGAAG